MNVVIAHFPNGLFQNLRPFAGAGIQIFEVNQNQYSVNDTQYLQAAFQCFGYLTGRCFRLDRSVQGLANDNAFDVILAVIWANDCDSSCPSTMIPTVIYCPPE